MPVYCFKCITPEHPSDQPREFVKSFHTMPKKIINQSNCPECGGLGKRDFSAEIPTQSLVGVQSISHSSTGPGSVSKEIEFAFGKFKKNPDGSVDHNSAAFRDTGELNKFMNGNNDMGEPVLNDKGEPLRRQDGSCVRRGAKLVKYNANKTPSRSSISERRFVAPSAWTDESGVADGGNSAPSIGFSSDGRAIKTANLPRHRSPQRGGK